MKSPHLSTKQLPNKTAEILLYGFIGDDVVSGDFVAEFKKLETKNDVIHVRINSGGGNMFEGLAIYNCIVNSKVQTEGYIDGVAASMATVIAMGCKKVFMSKNSMFMTHRASGVATGNADEVRGYANVMEKLEEIVCNIYAAKTGITKEQAKDKYINNGNRWITANEALSEKIIDGVFDSPGKPAPTNMTEAKDLVAFYNKTFFITNTNNMLTIDLSANQLAALNIAANADDAAKQQAINMAIEAAAKLPQLTNDLNIANAAKKTAEDALASFKATTVKAEVEAIVANGITSKKLTAELAAKLKADYATNPEGLKGIVDAMPAFASITAAIGGNKTRVQELVSMGWDKLDKEGLLGELKAADETEFKNLFQATFKTEYKA